MHDGHYPDASADKPRDRRLVRTSTPGIFKRGSRYVVRYRDAHGRDRKKFARSLAEARRIKSEVNADLARGEYRDVSKMSFAAYVEQWATTYQGRTTAGLRTETLDKYRRDLNRFAIPYFGRMKLSAITPTDVKEFAHDLSARGLARNTVRLAIAAVKVVLATAWEDGLIRTNPAAGVRTAVPTSVKEQQQVKALTEPELAAFLAAVPDEWKLFFTFMAQTGLRVSEAIAVRWSDIDLAKKTLRVERRAYNGRFDAPKSRFGRRTVPIPTSLCQALWATRARIEAITEETLVFSTPAGTLIDVSNVRNRILKKAAKAAGVPWMAFHALRHTYATMLFRNGWNAAQVQRVLGHHSPAFTLATYVHLLPEDIPGTDFLSASSPPSVASIAADTPSESRREPFSA